MNSDFADIANLSKSGTAGTATAAAFLHEFIEEDIPWAIWILQAQHGK